MYRHQPQHAAYRKPQKSNTLMWVLVGGGVMVTMGLVGVVVAYFVITGNAASSSAVPSANVAGAKNESELLQLVREFNSRPGNEAKGIEMPVTFDQAIKHLEHVPLDGNTVSTQINSQKMIAAEWLYGRELDQEVLPQVAKALGESFLTTNSKESRSSLIRAFTRWGNEEQVHLFLESRPDESLIPGMLDLIERYPTKAAAETVVSYVDSRFGDVAERIMIKMGVENAKLLVPVYDSRKPAAVDRVRNIFRALEVDVDKTRIDYYLANAIGGSEKSWEIVANIPFKMEHQADVLDGLRRFNRRGHSMDDWLDACLAWGDPSILPMVHEVYGTTSSFNRDKALQFITKYPDPSSVPILVDRLLNSWSSESQQISAALLTLYRSDIHVDFVSDVHRPVVMRYNDFGMFQVPALKNLFDTTNFDPNLLVDQCLTDMRISQKSNNAFETLGKMELIPDRQFEVAEAIADIIKAGGISGFHVEESFLHWATPRNSYVYDILNDERFGGDKWRSALRIALQGEDSTSKCIVPVARALGDFFKGEEAIDVLTEQGQAVEPLMIAMLQSNNEKELIGACRVLQIIGTEKCIPILKALLKTAKRVRSPDVYNAVLLAGNVITNRVGEDVIKAYEAELKQKANEQSKDD